MDQQCSASQYSGGPSMRLIIIINAATTKLMANSSSVRPIAASKHEGVLIITYQFVIITAVDKGTMECISVITACKLPICSVNW